MRKQERMLGDAPVLIQTLRTFDVHPSVSMIVVATPLDADAEWMRPALDEVSKLHAVVRGGASRQISVCNGLGAVPEEIQAVLVHDAARPFISAGLITRVIRAVEKYGAAASAIPVNDTVRYGFQGSFATTVDRTRLYCMQTPQGGHRSLLEAALGQNDMDATDEVELIQRMGHNVRIVPGDPRNLKITTPADWEWARSVWPEFVANR